MDTVQTKLSVLVSSNRLGKRLVQWLLTVLRSPGNPQSPDGPSWTRTANCAIPFSTMSISESRAVTTRSQEYIELREDHGWNTAEALFYSTLRQRPQSRIHNPHHASIAAGSLMLQMTFSRRAYLSRSKALVELGLLEYARRIHTNSLPKRFD